MAIESCDTWRHELVTPEHVLLAVSRQEQFHDALLDINVDPEEFSASVGEYLDSLDRVPEGVRYTIEGSHQFSEMMTLAVRQAQYADIDVVDVPQIIAAMLMLEESRAAYELNRHIGDSHGEFMASLVSNYDEQETIVIGDPSEGEPEPRRQAWREFVTCISDTYTQHNPLIGRDAELERTIQVLCRKDKNNPLHVGEAGVGKTALVYGLAARIARGDVPDRLKQSRIYMMDMGTMIAGAQFRGDFEKRIKQVMEGLAAEGHAILYIDEIHNMVGAGRTGGDASLDASNMLKPYLESGEIRFIGSTTYDEYNRYIASQKSLVRRFQQIDIAEPSIDDAVRILEGLRPGYEKFHGVKFATGAMEFAVRQTARHISDRFLPDKAIDLIDEAGAYRETHPLTTQKRQTVDRRLMGEILAKMCKIDAAALRDTSNVALQTLADDMRSEIFGQDRAVNEVVEAVQMAKAGLGDDDKPMASLLFVGPTGVGKTEVARTLARQLGVSLVRFDMSEYAEKHAVAKLIGAPATDDGLRNAHRQPRSACRPAWHYHHHDIQRRRPVCLTGKHRIHGRGVARRSNACTGEENIQARVYQPTHRYSRLWRHDTADGVAHTRQEDCQAATETYSQERDDAPDGLRTTAAAQPRFHARVRSTRDRPRNRLYAQAAAYARTALRKPEEGWGGVGRRK